MANENILIVDDNPSNLKLVKILLQNNNYNLATALNAEETFEILKTFQPALILMDIQLPGMDGLELAFKLRSDPKYDKVVILAITAYAMRGDEEKSLDAGCDGYISKPIDTRTLPVLIEHFLRSGRTLNRDKED
jgi:two-component system cell cycle response regulator DivK